MSVNILKYESDIWKTADLLRGSGFKESDFRWDLKHKLLDYSPQKSRKVKPGCVPKLQSFAQMACTSRATATEVRGSRLDDSKGRSVRYKMCLDKALVEEMLASTSTHQPDMATCSDSSNLPATEEQADGNTHSSVLKYYA